MIQVLTGLIDCRRRLNTPYGRHYLTSRQPNSTCGGDEVLFRHYLGYVSEIASTNFPQEFLAFYGVVGLGRLLAEGNREVLGMLR